jgi:hypothetical protein
MNNLRSLYYGLVGAARLLHFDASGAHIMVQGIRGFWASLYWSMALVAPFFLLLILLRYDPAKYDALRYTLVNAEIYILAWMSFPVVMERVSYFIDRRDCYLKFIISYNWLSCFYNIFYLLVGLAQASNMISWEAASSCSIVLMFAGLFWIGYAAKKTLDLPVSAIIGIVIIDVFLSLMISLLSTSLLATSGIG